MAERKTITITLAEFNKLRAIKESKEEFVDVKYDWGQFLLTLASESGSAAALRKYDN